MRIVPDHNRESLRRGGPALLAAALLAALVLLLFYGAPAPAQDIQSQLDEKEAQLSKVQDRKGVLTTEISGYTDRIDQLEGEVAVLRNREVAVEAELADKQAELDRAVAELQREREHLQRLRAHLKRSLQELRERLVVIYESGTPDVVSVILEAEGFSDLVTHTEYLEQIRDQDDAIVGRVRSLRDQTRAIVDRLRIVKVRIEAARDAIAAKERELERTRVSLEGRQAELIQVRGRRHDVLEQIEAHEEELHGDVADLQAEIQQQLTGVAPLPAGPVRGGSGMFIWPVNGAVVSGFGPRWGSMHEGVDIAVPAGTPIRAAAGGSVALAGPTGGYGNYTCIDHGGGLSTCYAHQSSMAVSSGASVGQGQVIGYVGCTGHCFGDHLHFEVRVNGAATDPLAYL